MSARKTSIAVVMLFAAVAAQQARAELLIATFNGTVTGPVSATSAFPFTLAIGDHFSFELTYDDAMPQISSSATGASYSGGFVEANLRFSTGSIPLTFGSTSVTSLAVTNDLSYDVFIPPNTSTYFTDMLQFSLRGNMVNGFDRNVSLVASVTDTSASTVLDGIEFPTPSEVVALFAAATTQAPNNAYLIFNTNVYGQGGASLVSRIDSVSIAPAPVPLPGAAGLFSLALLGLARRGRRILALDARAPGEA